MDFGLDFFRAQVLEVIESIVRTDDEWLTSRLQDEEVHKIDDN
jgi:hypothetical protein